MSYKIYKCKYLYYDEKKKHFKINEHCFKNKK